MKKNDVKLGGEYIAKVSGKLVHVRLTRENPHGGWDAVNLATKKAVRIKSAQRLRAPAGVTKAKVAVANVAGSALAKDKLSDGVKKDLAEIDRKLAEPDPKHDAAVKASEKGRTEKKEKKAAKGQPKPPRASLINLAAEVLAETKTPLDCKTIVEKVLAKGTWKTSGKTPAATLYSAIIREIGKAGDKARFRKVDRGQFELAVAK